MVGTASWVNFHHSGRRRDAFDACSLKGRLLGFEPKLLRYRLPVKVYVLRTDLIALNLSDGSHRIGDGATGRRGVVYKRTGVGAV
jgi:hypothetical protein